MDVAEGLWRDVEDVGRAMDWSLDYYCRILGGDVGVVVADGAAQWTQQLLMECERTTWTCKAETQRGSSVGNVSAGRCPYDWLFAAADRYICIADKAPSAKHFS